MGMWRICCKVAARLCSDGRNSLMCVAGVAVKGRNTKNNKET